MNKQTIKENGKGGQKFYELQRVEKKSITYNQQGIEDFQQDAILRLLEAKQGVWSLSKAEQDRAFADMEQGKEVRVLDGEKVGPISFSFLAAIVSSREKNRVRDDKGMITLSCENLGFSQDMEGVDVIEKAIDSNSMANFEKMQVDMQIESIESYLSRKLSKKEDSIFTLWFLENKGYKEISEELEIGLKACRKRVERLKDKLEEIGVSVTFKSEFDQAISGKAGVLLSSQTSGKGSNPKKARKLLARKKSKPGKAITDIDVGKLLESLDYSLSGKSGAAKSTFPKSDLVFDWNDIERIEGKEIPQSYRYIEGRGLVQVIDAESMAKLPICSLKHFYGKKGKAAFKSLCGKVFSVDPIGYIEVRKIPVCDHHPADMPVLKFKDNPNHENLEPAYYHRWSKESAYR